MIRKPATLSTLLLILASLSPLAAEADAPASAASPAASTVATPLANPENVRRVMGEVGQILGDQRSARQSMLAALTPAHRTLLAQIVGELVVAPEPDVAGGARRLNAALSPREVQIISSVEQAKNAALMMQVQQLATSTGTKPPASSATTASERNAPGAAAAIAPFGGDAGSILLRTAAENLLIPNVNVLMQSLPPR